MTDASVARQVAASAGVTLVGVLAVVGCGTAFVLHGQRVAALDEALLAAAYGRAHPDIDAEIEIEHDHPPVQTWIAEDDARVPPDLLRLAREREEPTFETLQGQRVVLLPFEVEHRGEDAEFVAVASAPRVSWQRSVGPFAVVYSVFALLAALAAMLVQSRFVRRAFQPLDRARAEADRVAGFDASRRLTEDAPAEIRPLLRAINELLERLEAAHQAQSRFTAEAAHELRTPVTAMLGELDVALRNPRPAEEYEALLRSMREEVQRLRMLVDGLTALTRVETGEANRNRVLTRAGEVATRVLAAERTTLAAAGNHVELVVDDDPEIEVNLALVEVALANLLRNAARHAAGAPVVLRVWRTDEHAVFDVDDAGPGVPAADREPLFGRFVRLGDARERDRAGLGLGLSIAREIARHHGGDCVLDASPQGGLRARLSLRTVQI